MRRCQTCPATPGIAHLSEPLLAGWRAARWHPTSADNQRRWVSRFAPSGLGFDLNVIRRQALPMAIPHRIESRLDASGEQRRVEQRRGRAIARDAGAVRAAAAAMLPRSARATRIPRRRASRVLAGPTAPSRLAQRGRRRWLRTASTPAGRPTARHCRWCGRCSGRCRERDPRARGAPDARQAPSVLPRRYRAGSIPRELRLVFQREAHRRCS